MQNEHFTVANVKCGGCVKNIQTGLGQLPGISKVEVTIEGGKVDVAGEQLSHQAIHDKLAELGYPEV